MAATGTRVEFSGVNIFRMADGRIAEIWNHRDDLALYQQLGAIPPPPSPGPR
jgi:predicted ester cyclase